MDAFDAGVVTFSASLSDKKDYYSTLAPKLSSVLKVYIAILTVTYTSSIVSMLVVEDTQGTVSDLTQAIQYGYRICGNSAAEQSLALRYPNMNYVLKDTMEDGPRYGL